MKINIGSKDKNSSQDIDYLYQNYRPAKSPAVYGSLNKKKMKDNKWVIQLLVSGVILLAVWGLFKTNLPLTAALKNSVKYLMTSETNMQPVFNKVIQLASQVGNVEWPVVDDVPQAAKTAVSEAPSGTVLLLPVSGSVLRTYGWQTDSEERVQVFHEGIDISAPVGTGVKASADGKVARVGEKPGLGRYILINNNSGEAVRYANLSEIRVKQGQQVKAGDIIGKSGQAEDGRPHVHFEVIVNGKPENPLDKLGVDFTRTNAVKITDTDTDTKTDAKPDKR